MDAFEKNEINVKEEEEEEEEKEKDHHEQLNLFKFESE